MVLIDTSIWIDHFRSFNTDLEFILNENQAAVHPFVLGELACGNFKNRSLILSLLNALPSVNAVTSREYHHFLETHELWGQGLGFVDIHLLAASTLSRISIFTSDKSLASAAKHFGLLYSRH